LPDVREINRLDELEAYRPAWNSLLAETAGASFFQSLEWLEAYWRHFGANQRLRVLIVTDGGQPVGIVPLVVRRERTNVGPLRFLTYPLHDWGSFYGPIGPDPCRTLATALGHVRRTARDWDVLELRWLGAPDTDLAATECAFGAVGLRAYRTIYDRTAVVDLCACESAATCRVRETHQSGPMAVRCTHPTGWDAYFNARPRAWRRNYRACQKKLAARGEVSLLRYRPRGSKEGDGDPRWDLYDACEELARRSWQAAASNGTTLSHDSVRPFLREAHAAAAAAGAVDLNLLLQCGKPLAFAYNYHWRGYVYGLRVGFDAEATHDGAGTLLVGESIRDSFARGDRLYDLGVGSLECKRHVGTGLLDLLRLSHFPPTPLRAQLLRARRWLEQRQLGH
jgi:CelD/BcsL family acetyltransferase involved in cellulose biosynthesis